MQVQNSGDGSVASELDPQGTIGTDFGPTPLAGDKLSLEYAVSVLIHLAA